SYCAALFTMMSTPEARRGVRPGPWHENVQDRAKNRPRRVNGGWLIRGAPIVLDHWHFGGDGDGRAEARLLASAKERRPVSVRKLAPNERGGGGRRMAGAIGVL